MKSARISLILVLLILDTAVFAAGAAKTPTDEWPAVAENQNRDFNAMAWAQRPITTDAIRCKFPCFDTHCDEEGWVYFGESVCRTDINGSQSCVPGASRFCMRKQLDTGFYKCETCFY